ncbi:ABC transporter permease [Bifidobacterium choloepi]|uniref:ABC transporter permease n=1 Tax=Bifidobacterium choloepi TaxID=2614131 RepID=A0A6I5NN11_9BIFI|nr:ABC transporter permease [Bifidobacterium choloepi]NEG70112.1 ABC transporter permease [Bifidobacterium choloepi]
MFQSFLVTLRTQLRTPSLLFWSVAFPVILATMFHGMFGDFGSFYNLRPLNAIVVADSNWTSAQQALVDALSSNDSSATDTAGSAPSTDESTDEATDEATDESSSTTVSALLNVTEVPTMADARRLLFDAGAGEELILAADADGTLSMTISDATFASINSTGESSDGGMAISVLDGILGMFNRRNVAIADIVAANPAALASPSFTALLAASPVGESLTRQVTLTNFQPDPVARYFYALLGMAALMTMSGAVVSVSRIQANFSALGMRRSLAPVSKIRQVAGGFLASWLVAAVSLLVGVAYVRYGCDVPIGGREWGAALAAVMATLTTTALGTLLGALPRASLAVKESLCSAVACLLSLFSGLYGSFAMELSDAIIRHAPLLALVNPAQQITNLFYDLLYYDSLVPFARTCGVLAVMAAVFVVLASLILRRTRHDHL